MDEKVIDATSILGDKIAEKIIIAAYKSEKTVRELSFENGIPIATCYEKIKKLHKMGLLTETRTLLSSTGKEFPMYTANIDNAYVFFDKGRLKVRFEVAFNMASAFRERYDSFASKS